MKAYSAMPSSEFIGLLRDAAINSKAPPAVIDQIDSLGSVQDLEAELEKISGELVSMEQDRDDLREELANLLEALADSDIDHVPLKSAYLAACNALERHGAKPCEIDPIRKPLGLPPCS